MSVRNNYAPNFGQTTEKGATSDVMEGGWPKKIAPSILKKP